MMKTRLPDTTIRRFAQKPPFMSENTQSAQNPGSIKQSRARPSELPGMVFWMVLAG
ncbi:hypothetical protein PT7_0908 [Pusillimonas sp. T7-7]|nr:hypothetical protein PT7_0908 [Pusillimonas sp. T7-7]